VHRLSFNDVGDKATVRRRIRHLERAGWIKTWEAPARHGGHTRYAHPTKIALRSVLPACASRAASSNLGRQLPSGSRINERSITS
jgi:predicted RNA binding protein YcfA (HicA-like mRNA interferase family)